MIFLEIVVFQENSWKIMKISSIWRYTGGRSVKRDVFHEKLMNLAPFGVRQVAVSRFRVF